MRIVTAMMVAVCLSGAILLAQTDRGAIRGSVVDPTGGSIPSAQVTAENTGTQIRATI